MYKIRMGGESTKNHITSEFEWINDETIHAVAYDIPITGFNTFNTNNLRLWRSRPYFQDDDGDDPNYNSDCDDLEDKIDKL